MGVDTIGRSGVRTWREGRCPAIHVALGHPVGSAHPSQGWCSYLADGPTHGRSCMVRPAVQDTHQYQGQCSYGRMGRPAAYRVDVGPLSSHELLYKDMCLHSTVGHATAERRSFNSFVRLRVLIGQFGIIPPRTTLHSRGTVYT